MDGTPQLLPKLWLRIPRTRRKVETQRRHTKRRAPQKQLFDRAQPVVPHHGTHVTAEVPGQVNCEVGSAFSSNCEGYTNINNTHYCMYTFCIYIYIYIFCY